MKEAEDNNTQLGSSPATRDERELGGSERSSGDNPPRQVAALEGTSDVSTNPAKTRRRRRRRRPRDGSDGPPDPSSKAEQATPTTAEQRGSNVSHPHRQQGRQDKTRSKPLPRDRARNTTGRNSRGRRAEPRTATARRRDTKADAARKVIQQTTNSAPQKQSDAPLTREEVARYKAHFVFLREHRKVLKLKLNAQEDLLLNGVKEPDSRGVVMHLLSKLEYARVAAATERFADKGRPSFVAEFLRFNPTLPLLLLYLEALRSAKHSGAADALSEALGVIDFREVSEGQMRRVLDLIVELVSPSECAPLLLQLLESKSFRTAFDGALEKLPQGLRELVSPLRAVSSVVFHGKRNPLEDSHLAEGINLLLMAETKLVARAPTPTVIRLLQQALSLGALHKAIVRRQIDALLERVKEGAEHVHLRTQYARALLRASEFQSARHELEVLGTTVKRAESGSAEATQSQNKSRRRSSQHRVEANLPLWTRALGAQRKHGIAFIKTGLTLPPKSTLPLQPGFCLRTQREVWVRRFPREDEEQLFRQAQACAERHNCGTPGLTPEYYRSGNGPGDFVCYLAGDSNLSRLAPSIPLLELTSIARQLLLVLTGLSQIGLGYSELPLRSFEMRSGRLRLLESWDAQPLAETPQTDSVVVLVKDWLTERAQSNAALHTGIQLNGDWASVQTAAQMLSAITALERGSNAAGHHGERQHH